MLFPAWVRQVRSENLQIYSEDLQIYSDDLQINSEGLQIYSEDLQIYYILLLFILRIIFLHEVNKKILLELGGVIIINFRGFEPKICCVQVVYVSP